MHMPDPSIASSPHNPIKGREFYVMLEEKLEEGPCNLTALAGGT